MSTLLSALYVTTAGRHPFSVGVIGIISFAITYTYADKMLTFHLQYVT